MLILNLAYRISVTTLISPGSCFNVVVTYEQDNSSFIVTVSRSQYVIEYGGNKKMIIKKNDFLMHYGVPRRSGRYPWGSGKDPYQRTGGFVDQVKNLKTESGITFSS